MTIKDLSSTLNILQISWGLIIFLLGIIGFYLKKLVTTVDRLNLTSARFEERSIGQSKEIEQNRTAITLLENKQSKHDSCENFKPRL